MTCTLVAQITCLMIVGAVCACVGLVMAIDSGRRGR